MDIKPWDKAHHVGLSILGMLGETFGSVLGIFFSGILVYHYPPWPTLFSFLFSCTFTGPYELPHMLLTFSSFSKHLSLSFSYSTVLTKINLMTGTGFHLDEM